MEKMDSSVAISEDIKNEDIELRSKRFCGEKTMPAIRDKKCNIRRMYLAAFNALLLALTIGLSSGYSSPATFDMVSRPNSSIKPTEKEIMWIGSIIAVGVIFGGLPAGYLANEIGRKDTLMLNIIPAGAGWLLICYSQSVSMVILGRFLCGVSCGIISVVVPVYCVEIATSEVRGILGSLFQGFLVIGNLVSVTVGAFISWRYLALHGAVLCTFATICFYSMPETPRWLLMKNKVDEGIVVMNRLQNGFVDAEKECEVIYETLKKQPKERITLAELTGPTVLKPALIGIAVMLFYEFSGANVVFLYSSSIFQSANSSIDPKMSTIILGAVQVFVTIFSNLIVDKVGRKILLMISGFLMALSLAIFGVFYYKSSADAYFRYNYNWIPLTSLIFFVIAFSIGYGPIPHLLVSELLPIRVRSSVGSIVQVFNGLFAFIVTNTFSDLEHLLGNYGAFWLYSGECILGIIFVYFVVPETKGKPLEEIENFFRKKTVKQGVVLSTIS